LDHLKSNHSLDLCLMQSRVYQPRPYHMAHVMKPGVWQPYFCD
jgi:hypothetical protein